MIHLVELKVAGLALTQRHAIQVGADGGLFVTLWTLPLAQAARWMGKQDGETKPNLSIHPLQCRNLLFQEAESLRGAILLSEDLHSLCPLFPGHCR